MNRKIKFFIKRHKKPLINVLIGVGLFICFKILNLIGNDWRGYNAIGGEALIFLLPFVIVKLRDSIHNLIDMLKRGDTE